VAKELGSYEELLSINEILKDGPSFKRQRAVFDETGDHRTVIENLVHELRDGIMSAEGKA
jgi:gamma-glutamyl:cysteine ligase YbdK (ATP-grasp superfamily)